MKTRSIWWVTLAVIFSLVLGRVGMAQDVVFQEFYWDTVPPHGLSWWTYIESQLPEIAKAGMGAVWVPAPYKGGSGNYDMGYGPYDLYDLGSKDQKGTVATRFGTKDEFLRFVAAAHRYGIKVYVDAVLNHADGADYAEPNPVMAKLGWDDIPDDGKVAPENRSPDAKPDDNLRSWTGYAPKGADGKPGTGRFPRTWHDFHPNETEPDRSAPYHEKEFGEDYAFHGEDNYVRKSMIAWSDWFIAQTGADGYRLDDVKGIDPDMVEDFAAQGPQNLWMVGEFLDGDPGKIMDYLHQTHDAIHLYDYSLYFAIKDMTFHPETFDMNDLIKRRMPDREHAVTFVGNHDMSRNDAVIIYHVGLAHAVMLAMSGTPSVYYSDFWRAGQPLQEEITKLVQAHNKLAVGAEIIRHVDQTTLALEREGHLLAVFNSGGDGESHTLTVATKFGAHKKLTDYVGAGKPITTDGQGRATVTIAPYAYTYYAPEGQRLTPTRLKPLPTTQTWEFADDLDTGQLSQTPKSIPITLVKGDAIEVTLTLPKGAEGHLEIISPDGKVLDQNATTISLHSVTADGIYQIRVAKPEGDKSPGTLTVHYGT